MAIWPNKPIDSWYMLRKGPTVVSSTATLRVVDLCLPDLLDFVMGVHVWMSLPLKATISGNLFITNNDNGFLVLSHYITHTFGDISQKHIRIYLRSLLLVLLKILMHLINQYWEITSRFPLIGSHLFNCLSFSLSSQINFISP